MGISAEFDYGQKGAAQRQFEARDLGCLRGGWPIFAGVNFALGAGDILVLLGPNGSGKSSLLRLLAGYIPAATGDLLWQGVPIRKDPDLHRARTRYLGHLDAVKAPLTPREDLRFWARLYAQPERLVEQALETYALQELADRPGRLLSAGQRRRLALARLKVAPAPLWLLDEPTVGLDSASQQALAATIARHRAAGGLLIMATHQALPGVTDSAARLDMNKHRPPPPDPEALFL